MRAAAIVTGLVTSLATALAVALASLALGACAAAPDEPAWAWDLPPGLPAPAVPADNPMTAAKVALGRHLFYDARLSGPRTQSCATCHVQAHAFAEPRATSRGATGEVGRRNAPGLANLAYREVLTWADPGQARLEDQAHAPLFGTTPVEMGLPADEAALAARLAEEPAYDALFAAAFPEDPAPVTIANVTRALAAFQRTLLAGSSRVDRFLAGDEAALTAAERRGFALFESPTLGCAACHAGFDFALTGPQYFNTGLYDVDGRGGYPARDRGLVEVTGDPAHEGRFRVPSLRNVAVTAPYLHDGSAATLEEVLDAYARGGRLIASGPDAGDGAASPRKSPLVRPFALSAAERADLVAFLGALTDERLLTDPALGDPWRP